MRVCVLCATPPPDPSSPHFLFLLLSRPFSPFLEPRLARLAAIPSGSSPVYGHGVFFFFCFVSFRFVSFLEAAATLRSLISFARRRRRDALGRFHSTFESSSARERRTANQSEGSGEGWRRAECLAKRARFVSSSSSSLFAPFFRSHTSPFCFHSPLLLFSFFSFEKRKKKMKGRTRDEIG